LRSWALGLWFAPWLACASFDGENASVPLCGPLASLPPRAGATGRCQEGELARFEDALAAVLIPPAGDALVRVELDEAARVKGVCVEQGANNAAWGAQHRIGRELDALFALPAGPACAAKTRLDLNRYQAKWAEAKALDVRCTTGLDQMGPEIHGAGWDRVSGREVDACVEHEADWVLIGVPGTTQPAIFAKPEIPDPPGPPARDTMSRCARQAFRFEQQVACIEADGWERLSPSR
jgi:hypothetical protein